MPITIGITCRKRSFRVSSHALILNPTRAIITTPITWISMVSAMSDRPQVQLTFSNRLSCKTISSAISDGLTAEGSGAPRLTAARHQSGPHSSCKLGLRSLSGWSRLAHRAGDAGEVEARLAAP